MYFLCSRYRALFSDRCIVFDVGICKRFPDLSGNVKKIIDGEMDEYPEWAFFNVGTIDDVIEKAKNGNH